MNLSLFGLTLMESPATLRHGVEDDFLRVGPQTFTRLPHVGDEQFGTPEIHAGLFPMMVMGLLARVMPRQRLLEMMLLGEKIDAAEAARIGLVGHAVEPGELDETIRSIVSQLIAKSPLAVRLGLRAFAAQEDVELARALPMLRKQFAESLNTDDAREGLMAFLEKRSPHWTGK